MKKNIVKYSCCKSQTNLLFFFGFLVCSEKSFFFFVFFFSGPETFPDLTYIVQMRRRPLFYVFNMILPCFLITIVAFLGFCVPSDSGEKVNIGVTTLLSMTVFLMLVTDSMPPNSESLSLIGKRKANSIFLFFVLSLLFLRYLLLFFDYYC